MLTIAMAAQKGGAGKSTIAVHLLVCAWLKRRRAMLVDLDSQPSASGWAARRWKRAGGGSGVIRARAQELPGLLADAKKKGGHLAILDTAGRADVTVAQIIGAADLVLIPCRPSTFDLDASVETAEEVKRAKRPAYFVLTAAPPRGRVLAQEASDALSPLLPVAPVVLHDRVAYRAALADGRSVEELDPDGKAADEIRALYKWIMEVTRG